MAIFENVPYGDINNLNLDGIIRAYMSVKGLPEDFQELKDYVMNYFENLDVTSELYAILEQMIEDGDLDQAIQDAIDRITNYNKYSTKQVALTVGPAGCQFTTINDAITEARTIIAANPGRRVNIFISAGTYREDINLLANPGIDLYGEGSNLVTIASSTQYPHGPLYTTGKGYFHGIAFQCTGPDSYALHWENGSQGADVSGTAIFDNCIFSASNAAGVGCGTGSGVTVIFHNCYFYSSTAAAVYLHNRTVPTDSRSQVRFYGCLFDSSHGALRVDDAFISAGNTTGAAILQIFAYNCHGYGVTDRPGISVIPDTRTMTRYGYWPSGTQLQHYGSGNSILALNTGADDQLFAIYWPNCGTAAKDMITIPFDNADKYDIAWDVMRANGSGSDLSVNILSQTRRFIFAQVANVPTGTTFFNIRLHARTKLP